MSLLAAVLWLVASLLGHLAVHVMSRGAEEWPRFGVTDSIAIASIVVSLALFAINTRWQAVGIMAAHSAGGGLVAGFLFPTERWKRITTPKLLQP